MIVRIESTITDYHAPFDQGFRDDPSYTSIEVSRPIKIYVWFSVSIEPL